MTRSCDEKIICLSCGLGNYPTANFCVECGAPLSAHAVNDPFDTIKTTGWAYRKSQETPKLIVVAGNWMIFSPLLIGSLIGSWLWLKEVFSRRQHDGVEALLTYLFFPVLLAGALYISAMILYRTTTSYLAAPKRAARTADDDEDDDADDEDDGGEFDEEIEDEERD